MTMALTEQTKIQLIDQVDNTFAKINIILNDIHDDYWVFFSPLSAVPISESWRKTARPHTAGWTGPIQRVHH